MSTALCWLNGDIMPATDAKISVFDHGLLYGDGVFEGIRFYQRRPFRLADHLDRLWHSAAALNLDIPYHRAELTAACEQLANRLPQPEGYLRLVVTRGIGALGIDPRSCERPAVFIIADQLAVTDSRAAHEGARLITASVRQKPADTLDPKVKSLNYLTNILARIEANAAGADEALLLNRQGRVTEGSVSNLFAVHQGTLLTPPVQEGILAGITRQTVLEIASELGIENSETPLTLYDLYSADECFMTGTGAELVPIASIDGRSLPLIGGPIFHAIQKAFREWTMPA